MSFFAFTYTTFGGQPFIDLFFILFFRLAANDRGYGHFGGLRERSLSHCDKVNAGAKLPNARQPANDHRRVLGGRSLRQLVEQTSTEKNEQNHASHNSVA